MKDKQISEEELLEELDTMYQRVADIEKEEAEQTPTTVKTKPKQRKKKPVRTILLAMFILFIALASILAITIFDPMTLLQRLRTGDTEPPTIVASRPPSKRPAVVHSPATPKPPAAVVTSPEPQKPQALAASSPGAPSPSVTTSPATPKPSAAPSPPPLLLRNPPPNCLRFRRSRKPRKVLRKERKNQNRYLQRQCNPISLCPGEDTSPYRSEHFAIWKTSASLQKPSRKKGWRPIGYRPKPGAKGPFIESWWGVLRVQMRRPRF